MNAYVASFRQRLFIQAAITGIFALLPSNTGDNSWLVITVILAAACAAIAALLPGLGAAAYQTALGFEVVAVLIGGYGLTQGTYIPGTIVGVAALIKLLDGDVKAAFAAGPRQAPVPHAAYGQQYQQPSAGQQYGAPQQFGGQQFGGQQFGGQPFGAPQPQPQYAPPQPQQYAPAQQYAPPQQYAPQQPPQYAPPSAVPPPPPSGSWPPPPPPA
jgi:hypothetical protein